jgi:hypothetical protein
LNLHPASLCLISGAPRSGTTALIEWLGRHPDVAAFQESRILVGLHGFLDDVDRFAKLATNSAELVSLARQLALQYYASSGVLLGKRVIVDKEPLEPIAFPARDYAGFLRNVRRLFPASKILLLVRDPLDTIWSMSKRSWGESLAGGPVIHFTLEEYAQNWCACADVALTYCSDPGAYVVQFGHLVADPGDESRKILEFVGLRTGEMFEPQRTSEVGFNPEEVETILRLVRPRLELLRGRGLSQLK